MVAPAFSATSSGTEMHSIQSTAHVDTTGEDTYPSLRTPNPPQIRKHVKRQALSAGVIGCGVRAAVCCDGVERLPAACLHAYADVKQEAADGFLATYGGARATTDAARILADPEVDAFLICTWRDTYAAYAIQAAQRGKKMLSEKALLLIHAEPDMNCGIGQSEELYAALQALGRPVSLVNIPSEGHLMNLAGTPSHRLLRMAAIDEWLARWL